MFKRYIARLWLTRYLLLNIKFNLYIKANLKKITFKSNSIKSNKNVFIPLIETNHYQFYQILILAKALEKRGLNVTVLICNQFLPACEIKNSNTSSFDPCLECKFNTLNSLPYFKLNTIKIEDLISQDKLKSLKKVALNLQNSNENIIYDGFDISKIIYDSLLRYFYGDIPKTNSSKKVEYDQILTTIINLEFAKIYFTKYKPDILLNNMFVYSPWEPYYLIAKKLNIHTNVISISTFDFNKIVINRMDLYLSNKRYNNWTSKRSNIFLSSLEEKKLNDFLFKRFQGYSDIFLKTNIFNNKKQNIVNILNIDKSKKNIFLFTNLFWDVGLSDSSGIYEGVIDWVIDTIKIIENNPNVHLYIKPHPAEIYDTSPSKKGVIQFILERFRTLPENVTIIDPKLKIKTYDLFDFIDLGLVYNGTIGIEMLLNCIPILVTGKAPYSYLNSVINPVNRNTYINAITNSCKESIIVNIEEIKLFSYFYFIKNLIPWNLTKKAYADNFKAFSITNDSDLDPGKNIFLDHICNSIIQPEIYNIEDWDEFH